MSLHGKTALITGASRGIGKAIALQLASQGANIALFAKTDKDHPQPKLAGTIEETAREVEKFGGTALPIQGDVRREADVVKAVGLTADTFGGIDIVINNAGAIRLTDVAHTGLDMFDLMMNINVRGPYMVCSEALPYLKASAKKGNDPHILNLAPPINLKANWFEGHTVYTTSKYTFSMLTLGMAKEFWRHGITVNALWPRKIIATDALKMIPGIDPALCRKSSIVAAAAQIMLEMPPNGIVFWTDEEALKHNGIIDFGQCAVVPGTPDSELLDDLFLD